MVLADGTRCTVLVVGVIGASDVFVVVVVVVGVVDVVCCCCC